MKERDSTRRTLAELRVIYELFTELRDVYVEGRHDRLAIQAFLRWAEVPTRVRVYEVDERVDLPASELFALRLDDGCRSRLIALALDASTWSVAHGITAIIDADTAYSGTSLPPGLNNLLVTDGTSIEAYALNGKTLDKFLVLTLRREERGDKLLTDIEKPLRELFVARYVLHTAKTGATLPSSCLKKSPLVEGVLAVTAEVLLSRSDPTLPASVIEELRPRCEEVRAQLPPELHRSSRGHDIALVIGASLNLQGDWARHEVLEGGLVGNLDFRSLSSQPMFQALLQRVA